MASQPGWALGDVFGDWLTRCVPACTEGALPGCPQSSCVVMQWLNRGRAGAGGVGGCAAFELSLLAVARTEGLWSSQESLEMRAGEPGGCSLAWEGSRHPGALPRW